METKSLDLNQFKVSQDYANEGMVKKVITTIPIKKPNKHAFFRVRTQAGTEWCFDCMTLEIKDGGGGGEMYFVNPVVAEEISNEMVAKRLYVAIDRQNNLFLWPVKLPDQEGKLDSWNLAAHEAAKVAESYWTRVTANKGSGTYDTHTACGEIKDPEWPNLTLEQIMNIALKGRVIENVDHPVIQKLKGRI